MNYRLAIHYRCDTHEDMMVLKKKKIVNDQYTRLLLFFLSLPLCLIKKSLKNDFTILYICRLSPNTLTICYYTPSLWWYYNASQRILSCIYYRWLNGRYFDIWRRCVSKKIFPNRRMCADLNLIQVTNWMGWMNGAKYDDFKYA